MATTMEREVGKVASLEEEDVGFVPYSYRFWLKPKANSDSITSLLAQDINRQ